MFQNPGYMKEKFRVVIETMHVNDKGNSPNVSTNFVVSVFLFWVVLVVVAHF